MYLRINFIVLVFFCSCSSKEKKENVIEREAPVEQIVVVSNNSPGKYAHPIFQDSLGKSNEVPPGPKMFLPHYGFSYLDDQNVVQIWSPKKGASDTLIISWYAENLELSAYNPYTSIRETFLVKNGDTVIFNYENNLPVAHISNREVNDEQLNYNRFRLKKLFNNKYSSHQLVFTNLFLNPLKEYEDNTIDYYLQALEDYRKEQKLLDSLQDFSIISETDYHYRINTLDVLMEKHKKNKVVTNWLNKNQIFDREGEFSKAAHFNLAHTDSLMTYSFFRDHLNNISQYGLSRIVENNGNSGGSYIDSRKRFDSILQDKRFNQTAKNFLLFDAYNGIARNFRVKDKQEYFEKLQKATTNPARLRKLVAEYNLDFKKSDQLVVTNRKNDTLTFTTVLEENRGKWLYVDFWASWCAPCRRTMPASAKLKRDLKDENIEFLYFSVKDDKENWRAAIITDSIQDGQHYFVENSNTSRVLEDLGVETIPHYIIYNPEGEIANGFADRPGKGAAEQLRIYLLGNE